jgi:hypothetical protein
LWSKEPVRKVSGVDPSVKNASLLCARGVTRQHERVLSRFVSSFVCALSIIVAAAFVTGCAPTVAVVPVSSPGAITADPQKATIVVIQPASKLRAVSLIDGHGRLIGQLDERSHTILRVSEGPTLLYAVVENQPDSADRLEGTLIGGRVYYAIVSARSGGAELLALTPRSPQSRWDHKNEYLARTPRVQLDPDGIGRTVNELGNTVPIMEAADAHVAAMSTAEQAEHQYQESDGL